MSLLTDLTCAYKLDGNANAAFGINNGIDGTNTYGPGIIGQAAYFDGTTKIIIPQSADFIVGAADFTVSNWGKFNQRDIRYILYGQSGPTGANTTVSFTLQKFADNTIVGIIIDSNFGFIIAQSASTITDNNWHHLVFMREGSTLKLYIDGVQDGSTFVGTSSVNVSPYDMALAGAGSLSSFLMDGALDDFTIWKRALTPAEIISLYSKKLSYPFKSNANFLPFFNR